MIEVKCGACGSTLRFAEADVPAGGKTVPCDKCKARVMVPGPKGIPAVPAPAASGGTGDVINLADLPAPKRPSPLAGAAAPGGAKPPPMKPALPPLGGPKLPPVKPGPSPLAGASKPPPTPARTPPPVTSTPIELGGLDMDAVDLPAPVGPEPTHGGIDLPAPKRSSDGGIDLPAPKRASGALDPGLDLPAPKRSSDGGIDLPAPKRASGDPGLDLPTPKRASGDLGLDLPTPKRPAGDPGLDLPTPKRASGDVPPPKRPAADALDLDLPGTPAVDLPAPKGFFDDLPAPRTGGTSSTVDLPAPKGFFDDLPGPASTEKPAAAKPDLPAPKGFFDDLPGARNVAPSTAPPMKGKGLDLDDLDLAPPTQPPQKRETPPPAVAPPVPPRVQPLELDPMKDVPPLELDAPSDRYGGLDLPAAPGTSSEPQRAAGGVVSFKPASPEPAVISAPMPVGLDLDVDDTRKAKPGRGPDLARPRDTGARPAAAKGEKKEKKPLSPKARMMALVGGLLVIALAATAFLLYQKWQAQKDRSADRAKSLAAAKKELASDADGHWKRAAANAQKVIAGAPKNAEALAIAAIANVAGYLEEGTDKKARLAAADKQIEQLRITGATDPLAQKALGLYGLVKNDTDGALKRLQALVTKNPKDIDGQLFLGWAEAASHDPKAAIAAFTAAAQKPREVPATYGLGLAQLETGDLDGARKSFAAVLHLKKDHIGAQIAAAAATTTTDYAARDKDVQSILDRKDIAKADPRAVALGWAILGDDARRQGHNDQAKTDYRTALEADPDCLPAKTGNAELAIAENRLDDAAAALADVLKDTPDDADAMLALADVQLRQGKADDASAQLDKIADAQLSPADLGRKDMITGKIQEARGDNDRALAAYADAQKALGDSDITPTIAQVSLLSKMAADAQAAGKPDVHDALTKRADDLLAEFEQKAQTDADMARTLGRAYLAVGNGAAAEKWLGVALAARKDDLELHSQLAQALALEGKTDAALAEMRTAVELDPSRADIGLDLATRYEAAGKNEDAAAMYEKLLAAPNPTTETRTHAGLFYARTGDAKNAAAQGEALLAADAGSAVGTYLRGEGAYAAGKFEDAKKDFKTAATKDPQAMFLDAWGRAAEAISVSQNATDARDEALVEYGEAVKADPKMVSSQLGLGRIHLARREWDASIAAFEAARALGSTSPDIAYGEGMAYAETNKPDKAIEYLQRSVQTQPRADAYYKLAEIYMSKSNDKLAIAAYANATNLAQTDERAGKPPVTWLTDALWQLGQLYADGGADAKACKAWGDYVARNPQDVVKVRNVKTQMLGMRCH